MSEIVAREEYNVVGNELYRKFSVLFGYIGLLSTVYASAILTTSSDALTLVNFLVYKDKNNLFTTLGRNHRFVFYLFIYLSLYLYLTFSFIFIGLWFGKTPCCVKLYPSLGMLAAPLMM
jgi:hypothetical protein